jgi:hypothetical protein
MRRPKHTENGRLKHSQTYGSKADAKATAAVEADVQAKTDAEAAAVEPVAEAAEPTAEAVEEAAAEDAEARANAEAELAVQADGTVIDPAAGLKTAVETIDPAAVPVEAPIVSEEEIQTLTDLLTGGAEAAADQAVTAPTIAAVDAGPQPADAAPSAEAVTATSVHGCFRKCPDCRTECCRPGDQPGCPERSPGRPISLPSPRRPVDVGYSRKDRGGHSGGRDGIGKNDPDHSVFDKFSGKAASFHGVQIDFDHSA